VGAEHLLIALLDQGTAPVLEALGTARLDRGAVRQAAAMAIGAPGLHLERDEAWRVADRLDLDDDQRYSLISHHASEVGRRVERARPDLPGAPSARDRAQARATALAPPRPHLRPQEGHRRLGCVVR
jgi:hypothetical protein